MAGPAPLADDGGMRIAAAARARCTAAVTAAAAAVLLAGCAAADEAPLSPTGAPASPALAGSATAAPGATPSASPGGPTAAELERCGSVLQVQTVRGLIGGQPEVSGGKERVTGQVTQVRCTWFAPNGRYITIVSLDGPGLAARAETVMAGAEPVPGSPGVAYDVKRGLIVTVDGRLHQIVAGGAGTAQARVIGLKAIEAIRAGG